MMKKTGTFVVAMALLPTMAMAQVAPVIDSMRAVRSIYPTPMAKAQVSEMLSRTLINFPTFRLLRKTGGNVCPTPYPGVEVSCDWVVDTASGHAWDVVRDVDTLAEIGIGGDGPLGPGLELVMPWPVGVTPPPGQTPQPQTGAVDYDRIRVLIGAEVAPILTYLANMQDNDAAIRGDIAKVSEQVRVHDEKTNVLIAALKNAKTYLVAGSGLLGWLIPKLLAPQPAPQTP